MATSPKKIKGVVCDLDGTLLDTEKIYDQIHQTIINKYGNGKKYDWDVKQHVAGTAEYEGAKVLVKAYEMSINADELGEKRDEMLEEAFANCTFMPGAREVVHKLKHELNLKIGLATSCNSRAFKSKVTHLQDWLKEDIDTYIVGNDNRLKNGKPDPEIFLLAMKDLGLSPEDCIIFEDSVNGTIAGIRSGVPMVVTIPDPFFRKQVEEIKYDKSKTKLVILNSIKDFDFSLIQ